MSQLVDALGGPSVRTVFRKLGELDALSSYSHRGRYYILRASAQFDSHGLWAHGEIRFSAHGTLRATVAALTAAAPRGWRASELTVLVGVNARGALRALVQAGELACVAVDGRSLYCATDPDRQRRQVDARRAGGPTLPLPMAPVRQGRVATATHRFTGLLDEHQRRLFAGLASLHYGQGGDERAAAWLGLNPKTVAKGRRELTSGPIQPSGGRKAVGRKSSP